MLEVRKSLSFTSKEDRGRYVHSLGTELLIIVVLRYCVIIFAVCNFSVIDLTVLAFKLHSIFFLHRGRKLQKNLQEPLLSVMGFNSWNIVWSLCFGFLATLIVVGNLLTIWIFLRQRLRKRAHFLLISLAVADLLVGLLSVPLYIAINTILYLGMPLHQLWLNLYQLTDIFTGIASIFTLAAISLERMYAIGWPFRHRTLTFRVYIFAISVPWILTAIFTSIKLLVYFTIVTFENYVYTLILFQSTPLLVICIAYFVVWKKQKTMMGNQNHVERETRLAKTLFIITGGSILTWLPFQILNLLLYFGATGNFPHINITAHIIKFLQNSNSLVNVIIYPFRISDFKNALLQMLHCRVGIRDHDRSNETASIGQLRVGQFHHSQEL